MPLEVDIYSRCGTASAAAFLHRLTEKHDMSDAEFLVDADGSLTTPARHYLSGLHFYSEGNLIEKWFQTVAMAIDRSHSVW